MAEYINKEDLKFLEIPIAPVIQGEQVHYEQGFLKEWLESVSPADVIERAKIDKAMEEIMNLPTWGSYLDVSPKTVIEIIKRNIGE